MHPSSLRLPPAPKVCRFPRFLGMRAVQVHLQARQQQELFLQRQAQALGLGTKMHA